MKPRKSLREMEQAGKPPKGPTVVCPHCGCQMFRGSGESEMRCRNSNCGRNVSTK